MTEDLPLLYLCVPEVKPRRNCQLVIERFKKLKAT